MYLPPSHDHIIPPIRVRTKILAQLLKNGGFVEIILKGNSYSFNIHYIKTKRQRAREKFIAARKSSDLRDQVAIDYKISEIDEDKEPNQFKLLVGKE